jgi:hypothetical protein
MARTLRPTGVPPPLLPGVLRLAANYTDGVATATNVLHFLCHETSGLVDSDVVTVVTNLAAAWNALWKPRAHDSWHVTEFDAVYAEIEAQPLIKRVRLADATAGQQTGSIEFANCCFLINWATGDPRRGGKPRSYLAGCAFEADADSAHVNPTDITDFAALITTWMAAVPASSHGSLAVDNFIEYSIVNHKAYRTAGQAFTITGGALNAVIGTQRRRVGRVRG